MTRISASVPDELAAALDAAAATLNRTRSNLVRQAIELYLVERGQRTVADYLMGGGEQLPLFAPPRPEPEPPQNPRQSDYELLQRFLGKKLPNMAIKLAYAYYINWSVGADELADAVKVGDAERVMDLRRQMIDDLRAYAIYAGPNGQSVGTIALRVCREYLIPLYFRYISSCEDSLGLKEKGGGESAGADPGPFGWNACVKDAQKAIIGLRRYAHLMALIADVEELSD